MPRPSAVAACAILAAVFAAALHAVSADSTPTGAFEVTSRLGRKLYALPDSDGTVQAAHQAFAAKTNDATLALKLSKAEAAKRQYREAVATDTTALKTSPDNADLYLERGHRELGLREFKAALADLTKAVELDPTQLDSHYHQGLAHYFLGEFAPAAASFQHALDLAKSSDSVIDCSNWLYVSHRRAGHPDAAAVVLKRITPDVKNTEPHLFFYLQLLHFYQGKLSEAEVIPKPPTGPDDIEGELFLQHHQLRCRQLAPLQQQGQSRSSGVLQAGSQRLRLELMGLHRLRARTRKEINKILSTATLTKIECQLATLPGSLS